MNMIYFDNSATTAPSQNVIDAVKNNLEAELFGNPGSLHKLGNAAVTAYEKCLADCASYLGCTKDEIYFTSCGTESANTAIEGYVSHNKRAGKKLISTETEHKCTLETLKRLESQGYEIVYIPVDKNGKPKLDILEEAIDDDTALLCFTHVNNETGSILPLEEIKSIRDKKNRNTKIYLDCVQSLGKLPIDMRKLGVDMAAFSGHKIHSLKGVGMLYVNKNTKIDPFIVGGGQQSGMRSGTQSLVLATAFTVALKDAVEGREDSYNNAAEINSYLREELTKRKAVINSPEDALPHVLNVAFEGFQSETMLHCLEMYDIFVSTVSACSSKSKKVSYVLMAMGIDRSIANNSVRLSFSRYNTMEEAKEFIKAIDEIYDKFLIKR
ncbi:cysteine desulfurase [Oscillospiraceae bacterium]|nr:cysteine desulfurase [Oscillospiraceae bacterium]